MPEPGPIGENGSSGFGGADSLGYSKASRTLTPPTKRPSQASSRLLLLEQLFERVPGLVFVVDTSLRVREANPAGASHLGRNRSEVLGQAWGDLFHCMRAGEGDGCGDTDPCQACVVRTSVVRALEAGASSSGVQARIEIDGGQTVTLLLDVAPVEVDGLPLAIVSATDITAQKTVEAALADKLARETLLLGRLARSQRLLSDAQHVGSVAHWEIDPATGELSADEHLMQLLGAAGAGDAREFAVNELIREFVVADGVEKASRDLAEVMTPTEDFPPRVEEVRVRGADGTAKTFRMHIRRRHSVSGGMKIVGWAQDITVLRAEEQERERHKEQFRRLIDSLPGGIYAVEAARPYRVTSASVGLHGILGDAAKAMLQPGREWLSLVHQDDAERVAEAFDKAAASGEAYALEYRFVTADGSIRHVEDWGVGTTKGEVATLEGVLFDVTESRRADRLLKLQRDLAVAMSEARSIDVVFQETIRAAILAADGDCGGIYVIEPSGWVRLIESVGLSEQFVAAASGYEPGSLQAREVSGGRSAVYSRKDLERDGSPAVLSEGITCLAGAPAMHEGRVIAWINVASHTLPEFAASSRASLQMIAGQFGSSLTAWMARQEYEQILQTSVDGLWVVNSSGILLEVNEAYCRMTGWSREELLGMSLDQIVLRTDWADRLAGMIVGTQKLFESRHRCKDGSVVDVEVTGRFASRVRGGTVVVVIRDISARLENERHVRLLSQVVEQNPTGVIITDARGRIEYVNPKFVSIAGYSESEMMGRTPRFLRARSQPAESYRPIYKAVIDAEEWHGEVAVGRKNGSPIWVRASLTALRDPIGTVTHFMALVKDITETRAAIEALRVSERRLAAAMEGSRDGLWDLNLDGGEAYHSPVWSAMLGYAPGELSHDIEQFWDIVHPEDRDRLKRAGEDCIAGTLDRLEARVRLQHKNGGYITVLTRALAPRPEPGQPHHLVGTIVDLTEQERIQRQLIDARDQAESASRAKTVFLANMSHEIRTPMNAILGYAQLLLREAGLSDRQRGYVGTILRSGDHLLNLINDVLAMSQIEAGHAKVSSRPFDWWTLLSDAERMFREKAESKLLRLEVVRQPVVPRMLVGDDGKLRQIIVNLLGNAIKFTESGIVAVRVGCRPGQDGTLWHELVVTDTGSGMTADEAVRVFRPFEQGRSAGKHSEGTGLGLAISADYARLLGGDLKVDSYPGMGSTFTLRFPANVAATGVSTDSAKVRLGGNRILKLAPAFAGTRALVADDLASNREVLVRMLEGLGFLVREADGGQVAIEIFRHFTPALVLLDRRMPGLDGYATMRGIRGVVGGRRARVLIVTASAMQEDREEALALGADGFVAKPIVEAQLVAELERVAALTFVDHGDARMPVLVGSRRAPPLSPDCRDSMPPTLASDMRRAAEAGDLDRLMALIPKLGEAQRDLQEGLRLSLEQYDYDAVITWLDRRSDNKS